MAQKDMIENPNPVIFDVGAHVGSVTEIYRKVFPTASIYAFEPTTASFAELQKHTVTDKKFYAYQMAIGEKKGTVMFNNNVAPMTNSLLPADAGNVHDWDYLGDDIYNCIEQVKVDSTTIDQFCEENAITHIDILKMDIQGYEYAALQGAKRMLETHAISLVYQEIIMTSTYVGQHSLADYLLFYESFGYELLNFSGYFEHNWKLLQIDGIFVQKPLRASK